MARGVIVTFSGIDGSGKSTQVERLRQHVHDNGGTDTHLWTRVGYTGGFSALKAVARRLLGRRVPVQGDVAARERAMKRGWVRRAWLTLALLDLLWTFAVRVRVARRRGRVVVCDRYLWDSLIDLKLNLGQDRMERTLGWKIVRLLTPAPDLALLFTVPVGESVRRSDQKGEPFRDSPEVLEERGRMYLELSDVANWRVLDGSRPPDEVTADVMGLFSALGKDGGRARPA